MLVRRDRWIVAGALVLVTVVAWVYLIGLAGDMGGMPDAMGQMSLRPWTVIDWWLTFIMWAVMMVGMMLPSAVPMILMYAALARRQAKQGTVFPSVANFVTGYLLIWTAFSALATALQWLLERLALLSPMAVSTSPLLGGGLLIAAGIYQWLPAKDACLDHCRSPAHFLSRYWRGSALRLGLIHGLYCLGCCWLLMGLLFFGGVMNLFWVAAIAIFVLLEKVVPYGRGLARVAGVFMALAGILVATGSWPAGTV